MILNDGKSALFLGIDRYKSKSPRDQTWTHTMGWEGCSQAARTMKIHLGIWKSSGFSSISRTKNQNIDFWKFQKNQDFFNSKNSLITSGHVLIGFLHDVMMLLTIYNPPSMNRRAIFEKSSPNLSYEPQNPPNAPHNTTLETTENFRLFDKLWALDGSW